MIIQQKKPKFPGEAIAFRSGTERTQDDLPATVVPESKEVIKKKSCNIKKKKVKLKHMYWSERAPNDQIAIILKCMQPNKYPIPISKWQNK